MLKTEGVARGFQHSPRDLANVMNDKINLSLLLHKVCTNERNNGVRYYILQPHHIFIHVKAFIFMLTSKFYPSQCTCSSKMIAAMKTNKTHTYTHTQSQIRHTARFQK